MDQGADGGIRLRQGQPQGLHQAGVAHRHGPAVHLGGDAVAAPLLHIGDPGGVQGGLAGPAEALGDGVIGIALGQSGGLHQGVGVDSLGGVDLSHLKDAPGQGAGLIKDYDAGAGELFQIGGALDQDAAAAGPADPAEEAQGDGDDQGAGAGNDQEGQGPVDPVPKGGGLAQQGQHQGRHHSQGQCAVADRGGVYPGEPGDKVLGPGLFHAGIFHQVQNLGDGGLPELPAGLDPEQAG